MQIGAAVLELFWKKNRGFFLLVFFLFVLSKGVSGGGRSFSAVRAGTDAGFILVHSESCTKSTSQLSNLPISRDHYR
jgi:hypothetical protein